jgi:hypothetical protein
LPHHIAKIMSRGRDANTRKERWWNRPQFNSRFQFVHRYTMLPLLCTPSPPPQSPSRSQQSCLHPPTPKANSQQSPKNNTQYLDNTPTQSSQLNPKKSVPCINHSIHSYSLRSASFVIIVNTTASLLLSFSPPALTHFSPLPCLLPSFLSISTSATDHQTLYRTLLLSSFFLLRRHVSKRRSVRRARTPGGKKKQRRRRRRRRSRTKT